MVDELAILGAAAAIKRQVNRLVLELAKYDLCPRGRARREADVAALRALLAVLKPPRSVSLALDHLQKVNQGG